MQGKLMEQAFVQFEEALLARAPHSGIKHTHCHSPHGRTGLAFIYALPSGKQDCLFKVHQSIDDNNDAITDLFIDGSFESHSSEEWTEKMCKAMNHGEFQRALRKIVDYEFHGREQE